jgi:hypothetical protein
LCGGIPTSGSGEEETADLLAMLARIVKEG